MPTATEIVSKSSQLVSLPDVYFIVKSLLEDETASLVDVADVISTDPGLTIRCLRLVNSAMFGLGGRVETISRAVNLLGAAQVHDLVLATSVTGAFARIASLESFSLSRFWKLSLLRAASAQCLASRSNVLHSERLFVAGLLSDIGHLVLYSQEPALTVQAQQHASETGQSLVDVQRAVIGCDYTQVGSTLMAEWRLPPPLVDATARQLDPAASVNFPLECALVHIAAVLVAAGEPRPDDWHAGVDAVAWQVSGLDAGVVNVIEPDIAARVAEAIELIVPAERKVV